MIREQQTEEYVRAMKEGKFCLKPGHMETSDVSIKNWLETGKNMPDELYELHSKAGWDQALGSKTGGISLKRKEKSDTSDRLTFLALASFMYISGSVVFPGMAPAAVVKTLLTVATSQKVIGGGCIGWGVFRLMGQVSDFCYDRKKAKRKREFEKTLESLAFKKDSSD